MASKNNGSKEQPGTLVEKPRASRRGQWAVGIIVVLAIFVAAAAYWRGPLAGAVLRAGLHQAGFAGADLSVAALSLSQATLTGVSLGPELAIRIADVAYDLSRLPGNPLTRLALDGLRIDLTVADGPLRRRLDDRPADAAPATLRTVIESAALLPAIAVSNLMLRAAPAGAPVTLAGAADGALEDGGAYALKFDMRLAGELGGEARAVALAGQARLAKDALVFKTTAKTADGSTGGTLALRGDIASGNALVSGEGQVTLRDAGNLGEFVQLLDGAGGEIEIAARTLEPVSVGLDAPLGPPGPGAALQSLAAGGVSLSAVIADGSHPDGLRGVNGTFEATVRGVTDGPEGVRADGTLSLKARQVSIPAIMAEDAAIAGPFRVDWQPDGLTLIFPEGLRLGAAGILVEEAAIGVSPVALSLSGGRTHALRIQGDAPRTFDFRLRLDSDAAQVRSEREIPRDLNVGPFILRVAGTADDAGALNAAFRIGKLSVGEGARTGTVDDMAMTVKQSGTSTVANLRGRVSARTAAGPLVHPTLVQSDLSLWRDVLTFDAKAILPGLSVATAKGRVDLFAGTGTAALALPSFRVTPGGDEFRALAPTVSGFEVRSGTLRANADLTWGAQGVDGTAAIAVEDMALSHRTGGTEIEGLNADIRLDRIGSPRTPPGQSLRAAWVRAGVSFENLALRFALVDGAAPEIPAVKIESFETRFAGGRLSIAPTMLDSAAATGEAVLAVDKVDLAALLRTVGLDGVAGTGRLSGTVPIGVAGKAAVVSGGRLAADGPGVLNIRSDAAKAALAGGGADVALMLSALEDFRYETLTLEIEKEAAGAGRVVLRTKGSNPAVRGGQPFVINLNVSGNVDKLAAVAAQALQLPGELVRSMLPHQP